MADTYPDITLIISLIFFPFHTTWWDHFLMLLDSLAFLSVLSLLFALTIVQDKVWYRQGEKNVTLYNFDRVLGCTSQRWIRLSFTLEKVSNLRST